MSLSLIAAGQLMPALLMFLAGLLAVRRAVPAAHMWAHFRLLCWGALGCTLLLLVAALPSAVLPGLAATPFGRVCAALVQFLGLVIAAFSSRYLEGEPGQRGYAAALGIVLGAVQLLLLAQHWVVLIAAWALVGLALERLLCFYPDRPFALLAAHKKRVADRLADLLLIVAAGLAWHATGSGALGALDAYAGAAALPVGLELSAACLALAAILRTALLPVHGWLIQVMEAPTPVSALLHAGVVNLGGFVLIRFGGLLAHAQAARVILVAFGLLTALCAGLVTLTRVSIKVRLAWSTVAQMGFMLLECGLGLYSLAALHLIGHSLYKAHAFLSASSVVAATGERALRGAAPRSALSLLLAPAASVALALGVRHLAGAGWAAWWSMILGLAWAPLFWLPQWRHGARAVLVRAGAAVALCVGLSLAGAALHALPIGVADGAPALAPLALAGASLLYLALALLQFRPHAFGALQRWCFAGFFADEAYSRVVLALRPTAWNPDHARGTIAHANVAALAS